MKKFFSGLLAAASLFSFCAFGFVSKAEVKLPEVKVRNTTIVKETKVLKEIKVTEETIEEQDTEKIENTKEEKDIEEIKDTELVFIIDKSGSMTGLESDTIGSFNSLIEEQKKDTEHGKVYVSTVLFDNNHSKLHDREDIENVKEMTKGDYRPSGCTALLDAVGDTLTNLSQVEGIKDRNVVVAIITDGYENSSREYTKEQVKDLIETHQKDGWNILFFGAGIDAFSEGGNIGIPKNLTFNVNHDANGIVFTFGNICERVTAIRAGK